MTPNVQSLVSDVEVRHPLAHAADVTGRNKAVWGAYAGSAFATIRRVVVTGTMLMVLPFAQPLYANGNADSGWVAVDTTNAPVATTASNAAPSAITVAPEQARVKATEWKASSGCAAGCDNAFKTGKTARRPAALPFLYAGLGVMQGLDLYSTSKAMRFGAVETNPIMAGIVGNRGASIAMKAGMTTAMIFLTEKIRKKSPAAAVTTMVIMNGLTAAVVAHNLRNAQMLSSR